MLVSLFSVLILLGAPGIQDADKVPPLEHWYAPLLVPAPRDLSPLFFGLSVDEVKERASAAIFNAHATEQPHTDWFWVLRSIEMDLGLQLRSEAAMRRRAETNPAMLQGFRLPASDGVPQTRAAAFYAQVAPKILRKKEFALGSEDVFLLVTFRESCSESKQKLNEKIYRHAAPLVVKAFRSAGREERGWFDFLVDLRDRRCLSEAQFKKLAKPELLLLRKKMPTMVPAEYVRAVYYLIHGGFAGDVLASDITRVAAGQGDDGNWGPVERRAGSTTPLYGTYIWAWVLSRGGAPLTLLEMDAAVKGPSQDIGLVK